MKTTVVGIIPARYGSTRLPGKALKLILGKPVIERVYVRAEVMLREREPSADNSLRSKSYG